MKTMVQQPNPTDPLTILEVRHQYHNILELHDLHRSPDLDGLKSTDRDLLMTMAVSTGAIFTVQKATCTVQTAP